VSASDKISYLNLGNIALIEEMYALYKEDPKKIDPSWRFFFDGLECNLIDKGLITKKEATDAALLALIDAYRHFGHLKAHINPIATQPPHPEQLQLSVLGFSEKNLKEFFPTYGLLNEEHAPLEKIIERLESIYCRSIGIEYRGCVMEEWLQKRIEVPSHQLKLSIDQKRKILQHLNKSELFEIFLHTKYVGQKRFSLEGGETLIPILATIIEQGAELGMDEFVIGMAHRGRLNVLVNIMNKSFSMVFSEFEDYFDPALSEESGDVKYHKGFSSNVTTALEKPVHISLTANPSHLESVCPVVEGKVCAKQVQRGDKEKKYVVPILIHGDSSIAGQGIVYETLQLSQVEGYATGGTIHIIVNNQIGFTTLPHEYRSSYYSTDVSKLLRLPVFHVNAEDPEGCIYVTQLALEIRQRYGCDVFIELNCYRKYGHNESDEPAFTQPLEYQIIKQKKSIREMYRDYLIHEGVLEKEMAEQLEEEFRKQLHYELEELKLTQEPSLQEGFNGVWKQYKRAKKEELSQSIETAVSIDFLKQVTTRFCTIPENFDIHPKLKRLIKTREEMIQQEPSKAVIDWGMAEHLAMATLLWEKVPIRLSGQDSLRATFTQRHAVWVDQTSGKRYFPLSNLHEEQGLSTIYNSPLSEFGVLGFEFGYSLSYPSALVIWEAQFGDFANGAQIIMDQYICSSEQKWLRNSGLVMLLPHGFEGQGPEHSSARIERFLQLSAESNMQIVYPTTPAQYFHLLRRQVKRDIRVPLIVFTPKGLLRHPKCLSAINEFTHSTFQEVLDDPEKPSKPKRLLICSGRIYYDLIAEREARKRTDIAIVRIEQLYPLNNDLLAKVFANYEGVREIFWVQEEPRNMGAWDYIAPLLKEYLPKDKDLCFVGRNRSASPAAGSHLVHKQELSQIMEQALS
jgi:2-oxoglutarate dehydrogenase E1 component